MPGSVAGPFDRHGKAIGASSSDAGGDAFSSNPGSAAAVAVPKARVQAPSVSEDEDSAELIVPDVKVARGRQVSASRQGDRLVRTPVP